MFFSRVMDRNEVLEDVSNVHPHVHITAKVCIPSSLDRSADTFIQEIEHIDTTKDVSGIHPVRDLQDIGDLGSTMLWYCSVTTVRANFLFPWIL